MATAKTQDFAVAMAPPVRYARQFDLLSPEYEVLGTLLLLLFVLVADARYQQLT